MGVEQALTGARPRRPCCTSRVEQTFSLRVLTPKGWGLGALVCKEGTRYSAGRVYSLGMRREIRMLDSEHESLLRSARSLLDRFMFEGDEMRDDVANLCMKIDDVLPAVEVGVGQDHQEERIDVAA